MAKVMLQYVGINSMDMTRINVTIPNGIHEFMTANASLSGVAKSQYYNMSITNGIGISLKAMRAEEHHDKEALRVYERIFQYGFSDIWENSAGSVSLDWKPVPSGRGRTAAIQRLTQGVDGSEVALDLDAKLAEALQIMANNEQTMLSIQVLSMIQRST